MIRDYEILEFRIKTQKRQFNFFKCILGYTVHLRLEVTS